MLSFAQYTFETTESSGVNPVFSLIYVALIVLMVASLWKVFVKAGQPGWAAIVPIYNWYILHKIGKKNPLFMLVIFAAIIPVVGSLAILAWNIILSISVGKQFGKSDVWSAFLLGIFSFIGYPMVAFGNNTYKNLPASGFGAESSAPAGPSAPQTPTA